MCHQSPRGFSILGLLITMVCIVVLAAILMTSMNKAVTGEGSAVEGTVNTVVDQMSFQSIYQSMYTCSMSNNGKYLVPSELVGDRDVSHDTTASFYSAMIAQNYFVPQQLVSKNEFCGYKIVVDDDYDRFAYSPIDGIYWDPSFKADLDDISNVSFAHMPLYGKRFKQNWKPHSPASIAILGSRGPKDGVHDPNSCSYGRNGQWGGSIIFGDGHIEFLTGFAPASLYFTSSDGSTYQDNLFAVEDGMDGSDSILAFTKEMTPQGPELQFD